MTFMTGVGTRPSDPKAFGRTSLRSGQPGGSIARSVKTMSKSAGPWARRRSLTPSPVSTKKYQNVTHVVDIGLQTPDNTNALRLTRQVVVERANIPGADAEASGGASAAGETSAGSGGGANKKRRRASKWSQSMASQPDEEMRPVASPSTHEETSARSSDFPWKGSVGNIRSRASGSTDGENSSRPPPQPSVLPAFPKTRGD